MEWLLAPIDASRAHELEAAVSWHGRVMMLAWGFLAPLAVLIARYFKVLPGQDWPRQLDNQVWWHSHRFGQSFVAALTVIGVLLVAKLGGQKNLHAILGYLVVLLTVVQVLSGILRGTKGGPTSPASDGSIRGDHYDMTPRRRVFEWMHKFLGYCLLLTAMVTILMGMWAANAPNWMWIAIWFWWGGLTIAAIQSQRRGLAIDTYQAIWGPEIKHPGNQRAPIGLGITRPTKSQPGE